MRIYTNRWTHRVMARGFGCGLVGLGVGLGLC